MNEIQTIFLRLIKEAIAPAEAEGAAALAAEANSLFATAKTSSDAAYAERQAYAVEGDCYRESEYVANEGALVSLAKAQDMAYCLKHALKQLGVRLTPASEVFLQQEENIQLYRYMQLTREYKSLTAALDAAGIVYMPLKGAEIRKYYPSPEMRVSSDIDVLVHESDLGRTLKYLRDEMGYEIGRRDLYDVSTYSPSGVHVEVHFRLTSEEERYDAALTQVWETSLPDGCETRRVMSPEIEMVYTVMHTAKHFHNGGCGARFLVDLFILENSLKYDAESVLQTLRECGLETFYREIMRLAHIWFEDGEHTELTRKMQDYILGAGIYGKMENKVAVFRTESGGRFKYILKRLFPPRATLALYYPRVERCALLYPYYMVKRWFRVLIKNRKSAISELKSTATVSAERSSELMNMLRELEL